MRAVIIDDEYYAIEGLKYELTEFQDIEIVKTYQKGEDFIDEYLSIKPDLVFLDIEMPELNGFDILSKLIDFGCSHLPRIVFVTAFPGYALQAFEVNALDYLIKPVTHERIKKTIQRILPIMKEETKAIHAGTININTFGYFGLFVGGNEIPLKWRSKKAEELFIYLLMNRGHYVSKEKISGDLWPNLDAKKGSSNLYLCYYYIKQTIKNIDINVNIESTRGKMRIDMGNLDCDFITFDELTERMGNSRYSERISAIKKICNLYKGPLLDSYYFEWNEYNRRFYEVRVADYCRELCNYLAESKSDELSYYNMLLDKFERHD